MESRIAEESVAAEVTPTKQDAAEGLALEEMRHWGHFETEWPALLGVRRAIDQVHAEEVHLLILFPLIPPQLFPQWWVLNGLPICPAQGVMAIE